MSEVTPQIRRCVAGEAIKVGQLVEIDKNGVVWLVGSTVREPNVSQSPRRTWLRESLRIRNIGRSDKNGV